MHERHGSGYPYRGLINFKLSIAGTYKQIENTRTILIIFFLSAGAVLIAVLFLFLRNLIISPILKIGYAVELLGGGDFKARVNLNRKDELGNLAERINNMIKGLEERFKLTKYVSSSTRNMAASEGEMAGLPEKKTLTVLFSDVRGFTSFTESHAPEVVVGSLNKILEVQAESVEKCGGDVDKFIGDEIMAIFESESIALHCAAAMIREVRGLNLGLEVGIGINSGEMLSGNIGSRNRLEYAVIGDTVNVVSRLCSLAKPGNILISESVFSKVRPETDAEILKDQQIKGKKDLIDVYRVRSIKAKSV